VLTSPRLAAETGLSLVEIVVALAILTTVLVSLGAMMFQVGRYTQHSALATYRSAATLRSAAWAQALPWDSIGGAVGCANDSTGQLNYVRCATVTTVSPRLKTIRVVITPSGWEAGRADTVLITRSKPRLPYSPIKAK
jgi:hypothetical protein